VARFVHTRSSCPLRQGCYKADRSNHGYACESDYGGAAIGRPTSSSPNAVESTDRSARCSVDCGIGSPGYRFRAPAGNKPQFDEVPGRRPVQPSFHGSTSSIPVSWKSPVLRVASVAPIVRHMAAICASAMPMGLPRCSLPVTMSA
jgi:hypothetical protein